MLSYTTIGRDDSIVVSFLMRNAFIFSASQLHVRKLIFCTTPLSSVNSKLSSTKCGPSVPFSGVVTSTNTRRLSPLRTSKLVATGSRNDPSTLTRKPDCPPRSKRAVWMRMPSPELLWTQKPYVAEGTVENNVSILTVSTENDNILLRLVENVSSSEQAVSKEPMARTKKNSRLIIHR